MTSTQPRSDTTDRRAGRARAVLMVPVVAVVVLAGVWVTGSLLTEDARVAQLLTGGWFVLAGLLALVVSLRRRSLAAATLGTWLVVSVATGGWLFVSSRLDRVVSEQVTVAQAPAAQPDGDGSTAAAIPVVPVAVAAGTFRAGAHPSTGTATLIDRPDGSRVLTLTGFATDPGPDLRVYLVPRGSDGVEGGVDLGALKGNRGDQQYGVPTSAPVGDVVIWCRAFSVAFGTAALST